MGVSSRLVPGPVPAAARPRPAGEVSVERENARFLESTLVALLGSVAILAGGLKLFGTSLREESGARIS